LAEFTHLKDTEVENLCKVIRPPGGTIPNPQAGAARQPPTISDPGHTISLRSENNLKLMVYFLKYHERTSKVVTADQITIDSVRELRSLKEQEADHKDLDPPELDSKNWPRTIEAMEEWLGGCLGVTKIPLAYVIREEEAVAPFDPQVVYPTKLEELIARAPILDPNGGYCQTNLTDRAKVWDKLSELTRQHDCWSYIRPAQCSHDGRMAFLGLKGHYLGVNNVDNMSTMAEIWLKTTLHHGEKWCWNFERYVKVSSKAWWHMGTLVLMKGPKLDTW
jgi:hypothetical protein